MTLEAPRMGGRVDVLAVGSAEIVERAGESVAIEIETRKSDAVGNVKQDLLMGWKVMVVATGEPALKKVERELGRAGLMIPGRVRIVRAGGVKGEIYGY